MLALNLRRVISLILLLNLPIQDSINGPLQHATKRHRAPSHLLHAGAAGWSREKQRKVKEKFSTRSILFTLQTRRKVPRRGGGVRWELSGGFIASVSSVSVWMIQSRSG
jgi:hypothetical protein